MADEGDELVVGDPELSTETLAGDLRDAILTMARAMPKPWTQLGESEQDWRVRSATLTAETLIRKAVEIVSAAQFPRVQVAIGAIKIDKGVEVKVGASATIENITALAEHGKGAALLVLVDPRVFFGTKPTDAVSKDEPGLPLPEAAE